MLSKKKKPASISINLVPRDPFLKSGLGRVITWMLSAGRYLVIFTEIIVIFSFASRFWLDRQVTDLNTEIFQKQMQIQAFGEVEKQARTVQNQINQYQQVSQRSNPVDVFPAVAKVIPQDINLERLTIQASQISLSGEARSQESFNTLVANMQLSSIFSNVVIPNVELAGDDKSGYKFNLNASVSNSASDANTSRPSSSTNQEDVKNSPNDNLESDF